MHIYWHNGGLVLWPDSNEERDALTLLSNGWHAGLPGALRPLATGLGEDALHLGIGNQQPASTPLPVLG